MSWAEVYPWRTPDRATPVVRQIYGQVRSAILEGALGAGARLPSSRGLAARLGVARASVVSAYEQLAAEGYVETRPGAGAFVAADLSGDAGCPRDARRTQRCATAGAAGSVGRARGGDPPAAACRATRRSTPAAR